MKTQNLNGAKSKTELAMLYFPDQDKSGALQSFRRLIRRIPELKNELENNKDFKYSKYLPPVMVCTILSFLGHPEDFSFRRSFVLAEKRKEELL